MYRFSLLTALLLLALPAAGFSQNEFTTDVIKIPIPGKTKTQDLKITFIGHGSLLFDYLDKKIYVDPWGKLADFSKMPKADLILITHQHQDHLDPAAIAQLKTAQTQIVISEGCIGKGAAGIIIRNGEVKTVDGLRIEAIPAYNIVHKREGGDPYHIQGEGNGYVFSFGTLKVYVAGDTENIPEMKALTGIDIAFLPMNLPYTMTPEMVADAAKAFKPKILYPYHFGETDLTALSKLMADTPEIEVRLRSLK